MFSFKWNPFLEINRSLQRILDSIFHMERNKITQLHQSIAKCPHIQHDVKQTNKQKHIFFPVLIHLDSGIFLGCDS